MQQFTAPARNVELKAKVADLGKAIAYISHLKARHEESLRQVDTYFCCQSGRLKLREMWDLRQDELERLSEGELEEDLPPSAAELIGYRRPDTTAAKTSEYVRAAIEPRLQTVAAFKAALAGSCGLRCVVDKVRMVWSWQNVRIHLDEVRGLGRFLEFEAVLSADQSPADGEAQVARLKQHFQLTEDDLVADSYVDLMEAANISGPGR